MAEINIEKMAQIVAEKAMQELRDNGVFLGRWIPVSEGLPDDEQTVLVTRAYRRNRRWRHFVEVGEMVSGTWIFPDDEYRVGVDPCIVTVAWMPLPEPYKAESEDKK